MKTAEATRFLFDEFEIDAERRVLLKNGQTIPLKPKAFDLLVALVEKRGAIVSKNDLLDAVWKHQFVEEKNLTVHIAALRKALGENKNENRFIATVPGTGYKFVAELDAPAAEDFIVETEKVERITIVEELNEVEKAEKQNTKGKSAERRFSYFYLVPFAFCLLLAAVYFWQRYSQSSASSALPFAQTSIRRLTTNGKVSIAALSPDGKLFAYVKNDFEKSGLRLGYTAGGNEIELRAADETAYHQLAFSPDSSRIYFSTSDEKHPQPALYRMAAFGGALEKIADGITDFRLSPDGEQIAFGRVNHSDGTTSLIVSKTNGADERTVFSVPISKAFSDQSISWSPDGGRLAFLCEIDAKTAFYDLCVEEIESRRIERISLGNWRYINASAWLKNGAGIVATAIPAKSFSSVTNYQIVFISLPDGNIREITNDLSTYNSFLSVSDDSKYLLSVEHRQMNNLWLAPAEDLSQARQITFGSFGKYDGLWGLDFTPDGRIIYTNSDMETQVISAMNADGNQKELTAPGFVDSALTVSNDGRYVVFHSNRAGKGMDIWRMDADGGNLQRLTFDEHSYQPSVSSDNFHVYYKCWTKDAGELRRVLIEGGEPEILTDRETGWTTFSPDGRYFAATYRTDQRRLAIFSAAANQIIKQFDIPKSAAFDMRPRWTPDSSAVIFRDGNFGYWSQPVESGAASRLEGLPKEEFFTHAFSKDGKQFAFVRGQELRDVVLLQTVNK